MGALLVGAAFFKGWIEERRQYLELLPLMVVVGFRWAADTFGHNDLLKTRAWPIDLAESRRGLRSALRR